MTSADEAMAKAGDELAETITDVLHKHHPMDGDYPSICYRCAELYPCKPVVDLLGTVMVDGMDKLDQLGVLDGLISARRARRKR